MRSLVTLLALAACGDNRLSEEYVDCDRNPHPRCEHPIDRIVIPHLRRAAVPLEVGPPDEGCRRVYIDLVDRVPTPAEQTACAESYDAAVARLLATEEHVELQRRRWAELLGYEYNKISTLDVIDLDARVASLERGELSYAAFASAVAVHPGFYQLHQADDWFGTLIPIFLGRPAFQNELVGLRPLVRMWQLTDFYIEGGIWWKAYRGNIAGGLSDADARMFANQSALNATRSHFAFNSCLCTPAEYVLPCASTTLGRPIDITPGCTDPENAAARVNARRVTSYQPAQRDDCFGGGNRPECRDRVAVDFVDQFAPWEPMAQIGATHAADLAEIGAAFAARRDFWEAAVDRELRTLLGWWQTTFKHPDSDLPGLRELLAEKLRDGASLLEVRRLIATSLLYRLPTVPPVEDPEAQAPWTMGPSKVLAGEGWLRSAAQVVGETAGACDPRWVLRGGIDFSIVDDRYYQYEPGTVDDIVPSLGAYLAVGGCNADDLRPTRSNIGLAFSQSLLARRLCAYGRGVLPPGWAGDLDAAATHLAERIFGRAPEDRAQLVDEMRACMAAPGGCTTVETAVRWMCRRMIDSAEFATY